MRALRTTVAAGLALAALLPVAAFAQNDLESTIRAEILKDPRTGVMSQDQIDAMISVLTQGAVQHGVTPQDITWRPTYEATPAKNNFCAPYPEYLCVISASFGFFGPDYILPIWLAVVSLLFLLVNALRAHHERVHRAATMGAPAPAVSTMPPAPAPTQPTGQNLQ